MGRLGRDRAATGRWCGTPPTQRALQTRAFAVNSKLACSQSFAVRLHSLSVEGYVLVDGVGDCRLSTACRGLLLTRRRRTEPVCCVCVVVRGSGGVAGLLEFCWTRPLLGGVLGSSTRPKGRRR